MISAGTGPPVVLIPGIQGRWEWMSPAIEALSTRARVVSYSLCGEWGSGCRLDRAAGFENYMRQLDGVFEQAGLERAALCGVSFGGLIAVHYAARCPERVKALVLVSAPGPRWRPDPRQMRYVRAPLLLAPVFVVRAPARMTLEVAAALPGRRDRWAFRKRYVRDLLGAPCSPRHMAARVTLALDVDFAADCPKVQAPTLVVTGERELDQIVPIDSTRDYLTCIRGASGAVFEGTGHLGLVTRPERFAQLVGDFVDAHAAETVAERRAT